MSRLESALRRLAEGAFICPIRFAPEFEILSAPEGRERAERWLEAVGYRLRQLPGPAGADGGAFYMTHGQLGPEGRTQVREDMRNLRHKIGPVVHFLETVRLTQRRGAALQTGDLLPLDEMMAAVRTDQALAQRLAELKDIWNARGTDTVDERLRRILDELEKAGYLRLENPTHKVYCITGKVEWLYHMLQYIAEHVPQVREDDAQDSLEQQIPLREATPSDVAESVAPIRESAP